MTIAMTEFEPKDSFSCDGGQDVERKEVLEAYRRVAFRPRLAE